MPGNLVYLVLKRTASASRERQNLLGLGDDYGTPQLKREKLEKADELLDLVRFIGNAAVAAFFAEDTDKAREAKRAELAERLSDYLGKGEIKKRPTEEVNALRGGKFPVTPSIGKSNSRKFSTVKIPASMPLSATRHSLEGTPSLGQWETFTSLGFILFFTVREVRPIWLLSSFAGPSTSYKKAGFLV